MFKDGEFLSFLDLLDLDEEVIDSRANVIMNRGNLSDQHLEHFIYLLQYKHLINVREDSECENEEEFNFLSKLIVSVNNENVNATCTIINLVLTLNPTSIIYKAEHLLQQILSSIFLPSVKRNVINEEVDLTSKELHTLIHLKICGSILEAVKKSGLKMSLPFLLIPLEKIVCTENKQLEAYFLTNTVPMFFEVINHYNILDRIWSFLKTINDNAVALKVLCGLSNYYLPIVEKSDLSYESTILTDAELWNFILNGLLCKDQCILRKQSIYLAKRSVDYAAQRKMDINIQSHCTFVWINENERPLKKMWENYFILIHSLEEKQSNIVLPSLKLFNSINGIGHCWLSAAFNIGLKHDNFEVRQKCLNFRFQYRICDEADAIAVIEALNDSALFDNRSMNKSVITQLTAALTNLETLKNFLRGMAAVKLSPIPLFSLTSYLAELQIFINESDQNIVFKSLSGILKIPCNNIVIRKAIYINISHFVTNCCKNLYWKEYLTLYSSLEIDYNKCNPFVGFVQNNLIVSQDETNHFINTMKSSHNNIPFALLYFTCHNVEPFLNMINDMLDNIQDVGSRQYSNKMDCLDDAIFITHLFKYQDDNTITEQIDPSKTFQAIMQYVTSLLSNEVDLDFDKLHLLLEGFDYIINSKNIVSHKENFIPLYKSSEILLKDSNTDLQKKLIALLIFNALLKSNFREICSEVRSIEAYVNIIRNIHLSEHNKEDGGRLRNSFYENICELLYVVYTDGSSIEDMMYIIDTVLECGGRGCLKWLLKITNRIISEVLDRGNVKLDLKQFLNRMWREIEDLKSNGQYSTCMEQFVHLLTQDALLKRPSCNNLVVFYCTQIINYAQLKYSPLYFLVRRLNEIDISSYGHMIYILSEILLYANVPKKEQRLVETFQEKILERPEYYGINEECVQFNSHIQLLAVSVLSKIRHNDILNMVMTSVRRRIDELLKNKLRYHENSFLQRSIESGLQCLLMILLKSRQVEVKGTAIWCMELLGRMPHQPNLRICIEWYICLYFYLEKLVINEQLLQQLKSRNVPLQSQFMILYWLLRRKIKTEQCLQNEFDFVMRFLTSHSMGPTYSIRLQAQYLATMVFDANIDTNPPHGKLDNKDYTYITKVIRNCLRQASEVKEKSFIKLLNCYVTHTFDIILNLTFPGIYLYLQFYSPTALRNMDVTSRYIQTLTEDISESIKMDLRDEFLNESGHGFPVPKDFNLETTTEVEEETGIIQKKYVPWKSMNIDDCNGERVNRLTSDLILVASLIDKLPNLGGMARTGEVFGVHTYVVDSLRHLQNRVFQDLSVSAERWLNVDEVRPGEPLKQYLMMKKSEGYTVVAAEQTSNSVKLQNYKFPKKTLLLLGHEKEGISCDMLPLCDACVEVPQRGVLRSLNVHVTAAIFVWEYTRQHLL